MLEMKENFCKQFSHQHNYNSGMDCWNGERVKNLDTPNINQPILCIIKVFLTLDI